MRRTLIVALAVLLAGSSSPALAEPEQTGPEQAGPEQTGPPTGGKPIAERFLTQRIDWTPCAEPDLAGLECGDYRTPHDWNAPDDPRSVTIAVSRLRTAGGVTRSLLTNPGGPGAPGRWLPLRFASRQRLLASTEIIGVDVRGTGASTNLTCGNLDWTTIADPRDRSRANTDLLYDAAQLQARACQSRSGDTGRVVTTEQTVRDLDLLRHLLGRPQADWVGYSGGTWIGAYYATFFPKRVGRFVLDSNVDFTAPWKKILNDSFGPGFQRRFEVDYLPWVARHDAHYRLGSTPQEVLRVYEAVRAKVKAEPVALEDGTVVNEILFDLLFAQTQYLKELFPQLTPLLSYLAHALGVVGGAEATGSATASNALAALAARHPDASNATLHAIACNDTPFQGDRRSLARDAERSGARYPFFGYYQPVAPCAFWNRPQIALPTPNGKGVPPVLMVQSERDPATPVEGATRAHRAFAGSRLLTVVNEGDHGLYANGNACVDDVVEAFLVDGAVPKHDLTCAGLPLPEPVTTESAPTLKPGLTFPL
ncbi:MULTISPECIES: alpha/beta hydrolase [Actinosynnema]|uniref:alpha/beta hydrolase n=1 Tax=Actinosynnema TaxID=40566 RepID=UPI0020A55232|nr:alpha/beta hydrolase [Actinosynnema pretiosum]MCP2099325.1 TAP-like protein [Actinosynnema pretiosum]